MSEDYVQEPLMDDMTDHYVDNVPQYADSVPPEDVITEILARLDMLTDAIRVIGQQQQYVTDTVSQFGAQAAAMAQQGGPLGGIARMLLGGIK